MSKHIDVKFKQYKEHKMEDFISFTEKEHETIKNKIIEFFEEELKSKDNFINISFYYYKDMNNINVNCNYFEISTELFIIRLYKTKNNTIEFQFVDYLLQLDKMSTFTKNNWYKVFKRVKWIVEIANNNLKLLNTDRKNKIKILYNNTLKEFNSFLSDNKINNHIVRFDDISNSIEIAFEKYILIIYININNKLSYIIRVVNEDSYIHEYDVNTINLLFNFYKEKIKDYL